MKSRKFISHEIYIKDLDKRFIDREELKEKIKSEIMDIDETIPMAFYEEGKLYAYENILKLLEE